MRLFNYPYISVDFYHKIKSEFFISTKQLIRVVRLKLDSKNVKANSVLTPLLSPLSININDFCKKANLITDDFDTDFPVRIDLLLLKDKKFNLELKPLPLATIIENFLIYNDKNYSLSITKINLYKTFIIYSLFNKRYYKNDLKNIFGTLKSFGFCKII